MIIVFVEQLIDNLNAHRQAAFGDRFGNVAGGQIGPNDVGIDGTPSGLFGENVAEGLAYFGLLDDFAFASTPFFRTS